MKEYLFHTICLNISNWFYNCIRSFNNTTVVQKHSPITLFTYRVSKQILLMLNWYFSLMFIRIEYWPLNGTMWHFVDCNTLKTSFNHFYNTYNLHSLELKWNWCKNTVQTKYTYHLIQLQSAKIFFPLQFVNIMANKDISLI